MNPKSIVRLSCGVVAFLALACSPLLAQMDRPYDTSYTADDAFMTIVIKPSRMLSLIEEDSLFYTEFLPMLEDEVGIDVENIEQMMFQMGTNSDRGDFGEDLFSVAMRFNEDFDIEAFVGQGWSSADKVDYNGRPMFKATNDYQPSVYFPDDRTVIIAETPRLERLADNPMSMGMVVSKIGRLPLDCELALIMQGSLMPDELHAEFFRGFPGGLPLDIPDMTRKVDLAFIKLQLESNTPVLATLEMVSEEVATEGQKQIEASLEMGRQMLPLLEREMVESVPEDMRAESMKSYKTLSRFLEGVETSADENVITFKYEQEGGMPELLVAAVSEYTSMIVRSRRAVEEEMRRIEGDRIRLEREFRDRDK